MNWGAVGRVWRWTLGLLGAVALGGLAWWLAQPVSPETRVLPDGARITLEGVTFGTEHRYARMRQWQRLLGGWLPGGARGREVGSFTTRDPALGFLVSRERGGARPPLSRVELLDEHGCRFGRGPQRVEVTPLSRGPTRVFFSFGAESLPRRAGKLHLRVYEGENPGLIAEFAAPNPIGRVYPTWTAPALPTLQADEGLSITLTHLESGLTWEQLRTTDRPSLGRMMGLYQGMEQWRRRTGSPLLAPGSTSWTRAEFAVARGDRKTLAWRPDEITLSDPTGNAVTYSAQDGGLAAGFLRDADPASGIFALAFPTPLCPKEPAWKVQARFLYAASDQNFGFADFLWSVPNLSLPPKETVATLGLTTVQKGVTLQLLDFAGPEAAFPDHPEFPVERPHVRVFVTPPPGEAVQLGLKATDQKGRPVPCPPRGGPRPGDPDQRWYWGMKLPDGAEKVNLLIAGWKSRTVEFLAPPGRR